MSKNLLPFEQEALSIMDGMKEELKEDEERFHERIERLKYLFQCHRSLYGFHEYLQETFSEKSKEEKERYKNLAADAIKLNATNREINTMAGKIKGWVLLPWWKRLFKTPKL